MAAATTTSNINPDALCLTSLGETLLAVILSYNSASDLVHVLDSQSPILIKAVRLALSNTTLLHFSYLLQLDRCRNHGSGKKLTSHNHQEEAIRILFDAIMDDDGKDDNNDHDSDTIRISRGRAKLERIEFTGLRHIVGDQGNWLSRIFASNTLTRVTSVDFSGCAMLDPKLVQTALTPATDTNNNNNTSTPPTSSIRHLNFHGCYRIDAQVVTALIFSRRFQNLQSLGLGGCSQSIADECVHYIISYFRKLQFLDLSGLKRITENIASEFLFLTDSLQSLELAGCELLRFTTLRDWCRTFFSQGLLLQGHGNNDNSLADLSRLTPKSWLENHHLMDLYPPDAKKPFHQLMRINFNGIGTPRRGLVEGALPYFALRSMGALREVYLSGCEQIQDWEVEVLARVCANSLTCLEMRACCVGDHAVRSVGIHCTNISDVDFSACFQITDEGILSFCQHKGVYRDVHSTVKTIVDNSSPVKSLKIGALPQLTNRSIQAIASLRSLVLLDINNCPKVTPDALSETVKALTSLVELDAKGIGKWTSSVAALYSYDDNPRRLRFVNGRPFHQSSKTVTKECMVSTRNCFEQCIVRQHSKRLNHTQGVPLQTMYHCIDCMLIPSLNRGMCHACCIHCHSSHQTFVGSFSRFFCDCPFGIAGNVCQAISCGKTEYAKEVATNQWTISS